MSEIISDQSLPDSGSMNDKLLTGQDSKPSSSESESADTSDSYFPSASSTSKEFTAIQKKNAEQKNGTKKSNETSRSSSKCCILL